MKAPGDRISTHSLILLVWVGLIFFSSTGVAGRWANQLYALLSSSAGLGHGVAMLLFQKAYHVFLFSVLGALLASASSPPSWPRAILWSFVIGALSEALQLAFEGRGPSLIDVLLNGVSGTAGGWACLRVLLTKAKASPGTAS